MRHWPLAVVLLAAVALRVAAAIAYRPALFFSDSWTYALLAFDLGFAPDRPSGYSVVIGALLLPGNSLALVTALQHLAGVATGVLVYALLVRLGVPRLAAVAAAAVILLDSYAISLEQFVMAEAFFTLCLTACVYLTLAAEQRPRNVLAAAALLAAAACMRTLGLFAVPVWLAYVVWRHRPERRLLAAAAVVALGPLFLYASLHAAAGKGFGFSEVGGWALYSRVAPFADCEKSDVPEDTRALCETPQQREGQYPSHYGWDPDSPANLLYKGERKRSNLRLRAFGSAVVRHQPLDYVEAVGSDFLRFFGFGKGDPGFVGNPEPINFPRPADRPYLSPYAERVRQAHFPGYEQRVRAPSESLREYQEIVHIPRWLIGLCTLAGFVALLRRVRNASAIALMLGMSLAMLAGAASVEFQVRYLVPVAPLLVSAGALSLAGLMRRGGDVPASTQ